MSAFMVSGLCTEVNVCMSALAKGDLFIGRVSTRATPMRNEDFTVADMDSGSEWLKLAPSENYQYGIAMKEMEGSLK